MKIIVILKLIIYYFVFVQPSYSNTDPYRCLLDQISLVKAKAQVQNLGIHQPLDFSKVIAFLEKGNQDAATKIEMVIEATRLIHANRLLFVADQYAIEYGPYKGAMAFIGSANFPHIRTVLIIFPDGTIKATHNDDQLISLTKQTKKQLSGTYSNYQHHQLRPPVDVSKEMSRILTNLIQAP